MENNNMDFLNEGQIVGTVVNIFTKYAKENDPEGVKTETSKNLTDENKKIVSQVVTRKKKLDTGVEADEKIEMIQGVVTLMVEGQKVSIDVSSKMTTKAGAPSKTALNIANLRVGQKVKFGRVQFNAGDYINAEGEVAYYPKIKLAYNGYVAQVDENEKEVSGIGLEVVVLNEVIMDENGKATVTVGLIDFRGALTKFKFVSANKGVADFMDSNFSNGEVRKVTVKRLGEEVVVSEEGDTFGEVAPEEVSGGQFEWAIVGGSKAAIEEKELDKDDIKRAMMIKEEWYESQREYRRENPVAGKSAGSTGTGSKGNTVSKDELVF